MPRAKLSRDPTGRVTADLYSPIRATGRIARGETAHVEADLSIRGQGE